MPEKIQEALTQFAKAEGRGWKRKLLKMWETSSYPGHEALASQLQRARNTLGPSGLDRLKTPK